MTINYPGASAPVVADTVAAVIEQQVNGVEGMLYMSSQMGNDGSYTLTVTFDIGTDVNSALVMVQNRVALAMPQLPPEVRNQGITIRKRTPDNLLIVSFYSPDDRYDDIYLSNYATIFVKDELLRVYGVSDITYMGQRDYSVRVWLKPQELASRGMTAMDVASAIRTENIDAPAGQIGQMPAPGSIRSSCRSTRWAGSRIQSSSGRLLSRPARLIRTIRRRGSSGCVTWRGWSWARRTTTSLARSTATSRWASPSTSFPAPMRLTSPTGCEPRWKSSRPAFRTVSSTRSPMTRLRTSASRCSKSSRRSATR